MRIDRYKSDFDYTYSLGVYPTIELLEQRPDLVLQVAVCSTEERNEGIARIRELCDEHGVDVMVSDRTLRRLSGRTDCWAAAAFRKFPSRLDPERDHVMLVAPNDMGNVGTIMRTMLALGFTELALTRPAPDLFAPAAVRASMGALFRTSFEYFGRFSDYADRFPHKVYALMTDGDLPLPAARFQSPCALVFGNEGEGLPEEFRAMGAALRIPQTDMVDSLNLAVAVGITLYEASRDRL